MANSSTLKWIFLIANIFLVLQTIECQTCSIPAICECQVQQERNLSSTVQQPPPSSFATNVPIDICKPDNTTKWTLSKMTVNCSSVEPTSNKTTIPGTLKSGQFYLTLTYPCIVPKPSEHGYSTGSVLVIIFFTLVFAYLLLGMTVNFFIMGARGFEVIPNIAFWRELPLLVRDGVLFVQNGFKPPSTETNVRSPESYDSI